MVWSALVASGVYRALNADGSGPLGANDLTVTYSVSGTGNFLDASALHLNSGSVNLYADANFDFGTSAGTYGADMATLSNIQLQLNIFNQPTWPDSMQLSEIICGMAGYTGSGCDGTNFIPTALAFAVQDGGSVTISAVPEPETLMLLLAGLGGISVVGRRRRKDDC